MKGQVSAEMLILLAVVIAIVALAASALMNTAQQSRDSVTSRTNDVLTNTNNVANCRACTNDADCYTGEQCTSRCCG
jgi:uncharacterized protein (UPF0333 family)